MKYEVFFAETFLLRQRRQNDNHGMTMIDVASSKSKQHDKEYLSQITEVFGFW